MNLNSLILKLQKIQAKYKGKELLVEMTCNYGESEEIYGTLKSVRVDTESYSTPQVVITCEEFEKN